MHAKYTTIQLENLSHESSRFSAACEQFDSSVILKKISTTLCHLLACLYNSLWYSSSSFQRDVTLKPASATWIVSEACAHLQQSCATGLWPVESSSSVIYIVSMHTSINIWPWKTVVYKHIQNDLSSLHTKSIVWHVWCKAHQTSKWTVIWSLQWCDKLPI